MQTKFINENMDILHKYLIWKEAILEPQIVDSTVEFEGEITEAIDVTGEVGYSEIKKIENYGKMD